MSRSPQPAEQNLPLYIRWTPETCPYALEMRFDLISRLKQRLQAVGETSGFFVGVFPTHASPTLRLDNIVFPPNLPAGDEYCVGVFRSHAANFPMAPSVAEVNALRQEFPDGLYGFLSLSHLPEASGPYQAAFYLAIGGQLPHEPSTPVFPFEENAFQSLPELPAEATEDLRNFNFAKAVKRPVPWPAVISFALLLFLIGTWVFGSQISQLFRPASNQIDLTVYEVGSNIKITWDHSATALSNATGASLVIIDGRNHREVKLDPDDLKLGEVIYETVTKKVYVVMKIDAPGTRLPPQTFDWTSG